MTEYNSVGDTEAEVDHGQPNILNMGSIITTSQEMQQLSKLLCVNIVF